MILKIEVDLKEFYDEGEELSFSDSIKNHIAYEVKQLVYKDFKEIALKELTDLVKKEFTEQSNLQINKLVSNVIGESKIKKSDYGTDLVTMKDYIETNIKNSYFDVNKNAATVLNSYFKEFEIQFKKEVKEGAETLGKELKDRYDLLFASQLVAKMNENGMLKDDVAKLLLPNKES